MSWLFPLLVGALTGVLSGFGIGGGTLLVLGLTRAGGMGQLQAGGVNLVYFLCCALPALVSHLKNGLVDKKVALWGILFGVPACAGAAFLAMGMDVSWLRRFFGVLLLFVGWQELFPKKEARRQKGPTEGR